MSAGLATGDGPAGLSAQEEKVDILVSPPALGFGGISSGLKLSMKRAESG